MPMIQIATTIEGNYIVELTALEYDWLRKRSIEVTAAPVAPLSREALDAWEEYFLSSLRNLHLSVRVYNAIRYGIRKFHSEHAWGTDTRPVFVASWVIIDDKPQVARLYSFDEWCRRVLEPDFAGILDALRNFGKGAYAELVQAVRVFLEMRGAVLDKDHSD